MKYGILPRKSLTLGNVIENIPMQYRDAFIIGFFDGDGSISKMYSKKKNGKKYLLHTGHVNIRGTYDFLSGVCVHLGLPISKIHKYDSIPSLSFASKKCIFRFYQCYNNLEFYYKRKKDVFETFIHHFSYDEYK